MATVCLDNLVFYRPPAAAGPSPASRGLLVREGGPAPLLPLPPQQDAHDSRHGDAGKSQRNAILISDSEADDDFDDGRSDTSFAPPDELVAAASNKVKSSGVAGAGESRDTVPDDSDVSEPSVNSGPGPDDDFANEQQQRGGLGPSPETLSGSPRPSEKPCGTTSNHDGSICLDNEEWDRRFPFSCAAIQRRRAAQPQSMLDPHGQPQSPCPPTSGFGFESQQQSDGHCLSHHCDGCGDSSQRGSPEHHHHHLLPDDREQRARTPILPDDESTSELEPADTEPRLRPQSLCEAASSRGVGPQPRSGSGRLSQHRDHHDDSDLASDGERHLLVPDDRDQDEGGTPGPQDRRATSKSTSEETAQQQSNLALATEASLVKPAGILLTPGIGATRRKHVSFGHDVKQGSGTTRATTTELPDEDQVDLQQNTGRCRRRRRCDTDGKEDGFPIVGSDAKQGKDEDAIQSPRGKRRKLNTAPKRQARPRTNSRSLQAQRRPPPTQGPKRRQSQRRISKQQSSGAAALEEETLEAAFARFEEWPLEAVLKRVWVGRAVTFQLEFAWNPCTNHGQHERVPENPRRKPQGGRSSSTARALPLRAASMTGKIQGDGYFNLEKILKWRKGEKGLEYLVKWVGYGKKHNSWEPPGHFDQCLEILDEFHREKGLPPPRM